MRRIRTLVSGWVMSCLWSRILMATKTSSRLLLAASLALAAVACLAQSQESKPTIRHHRVEESGPEDPNAVLLDQAETAMQHNDFATAEAALQKVSAAKPDDYRAWFDLGYVYNATQRPAQAIDAYRKAIAAKPDVFESNLNLGLMLAKQGQNAEAAKYLKAATQLKPSDSPEQGLSKAWRSLGRVEETSDPPSALAAYGEAEKLTPKDPEPHLAAGALLERQNNLDAAAAEYRTVVDLDPSSGDALNGLINIYTKQRKYADAEAALRKLLASSPQNGPAHAQLSRVLAAEGKNDEAVQELQSGSHNSSGDPQAAYQLGTVYQKAGKNAEAEEQFRIAVQKLPREPEAHYALGALLMQEKKFEESQRELIAAINLKPDLAEAYGNLAIVAAANKNYGLALRALDLRAKYLPEIPGTYFLRATTYDNLKDIPHAVEYYQQFLAVDDGKFPDQEWQARHRLIAIDPQHADKYRVKVK
jgi:tetratricopeptide (TPR) repeat protein